MNNNVGLFFRCLFFLSFAGILPSVIASAVSLAFSATISSVVTISIIVNCIIFAITVFRLFDFRMCIKTKAKYYLYNLSAMAIYCGLAVGSSILIDLFGIKNGLALKIYTFMCFNFKVLHYVSYSGTRYLVGTTLSAICYTIFYILVILVLPLIVNKQRILGIKKKKKDDE